MKLGLDDMPMNIAYCPLCGGEIQFARGVAPPDMCESCACNGNGKHSPKNLYDERIRVGARMLSEDFGIDNDDSHLFDALES